MELIRFLATSLSLQKGLLVIFGSFSRSKDMPFVCGFQGLNMLLIKRASLVSLVLASPEALYTAASKEMNCYKLGPIHPLGLCDYKITLELLWDFQ